MTIASLNFLLFALAAVAIYHLSARLPWRPARDLVFLAINLVFLATFATYRWTGVLPMAGFVMAGYVAVSVLRAHRSHGLFLALLFLILAYFFWLKRYAFV